MNRTIRKIKEYIKKFFLIDDTPQKIAGGAAVGIFMGIVPGEGVVSTLIVASLFRLNRLAATVGVLASNMWTTLAFLPIAAFFGGLIFHVTPSSLIDSSKATLESGLGSFFSFTIVFQLILPLMVGYIVSAAIVAVAFYFLLYYLLKNKKIKFR